MHFAHKIIHMVNGFLGRLYHQVDSPVEDFHIKICGHNRDLAQLIMANIQPCHLAVYPYKPGAFRCEYLIITVYCMADYYHYAPPVPYLSADKSVTGHSSIYR